jgi:hypothetical protein
MTFYEITIMLRHYAKLLRREGNFVSPPFVTIVEGKGLLLLVLVVLLN